MSLVTRHDIEFITEGNKKMKGYMKGIMGCRDVREAGVAIVASLVKLL